MQTRNVVKVAPLNGAAVCRGRILEEEEVSGGDRGALHIGRLVQVPVQPGTQRLAPGFGSGRVQKGVKIHVHGCLGLLARGGVAPEELVPHPLQTPETAAPAGVPGSGWGVEVVAGADLEGVGGRGGGGQLVVAEPEEGAGGGVGGARGEGGGGFPSPGGDLALQRIVAVVFGGRVGAVEEGLGRGRGPSGVPEVGGDVTERVLTWGGPLARDVGIGLVVGQGTFGVDEIHVGLRGVENGSGAVHGSQAASGAGEGGEGAPTEASEAPRGQLLH